MTKAFHEEALVSEACIEEEDFPFENSVEEASHIEEHVHEDLDEEDTFSRADQDKVSGFPFEVFG